MLSQLSSNITAYNGDWKDLAIQIADYSIQLIITDPPYEIADLTDFFAMCMRKLDPNGSIYVFGDKRMIAEHWYRQLNIQYKDFLVWHYKNSPKPKGRWRMSMQAIIYGYQGNSYFNEDVVRVPYLPSTKKLNGRKRPSSGRMKKCSVYDTSKGALPRDVIERPALLGHLAKERRGHRDQKPESIISDLMQASSKAGDVVADFFLGSGTTAIVANKLGRRFIGSEICPNNFAMIKNAFYG